MCEKLSLRKSPIEILVVSNKCFTVLIREEIHTPFYMIHTPSCKSYIEHCTTMYCTNSGVCTKTNGVNITSRLIMSSFFNFYQSRKSSQKLEMMATIKMGQNLTHSIKTSNNLTWQSKWVKTWPILSKWVKTWPIQLKWTYKTARLCWREQIRPNLSLTIPAPP